MLIFQIFVSSVTGNDDSEVIESTLHSNDPPEALVNQSSLHVLCILVICDVICLAEYMSTKDVLWLL